MRIIFIFIITVFAEFSIFPGKALAIPAFARQYKTECISCHTIFPERNKFGEAFAKNSFVWPGTAAEQKKESGTEGDEGKAKELLWPVTIPDFVPVSFLVQHDLIFNKEKKPQFDLDGETELELFTGGSFRGKAGWWAEYNFAPDKDIGEVYIQFRKPFTLPLNVKAGRFKPRLSLWKPNDTATISPYGYNEMTVGDSPFVIGREQGGVEVNADIGSRVFVATGITTPKEKDRNGNDWYGHVSVRIEGTDFLGNEPSIDLDRESIWDYLTLTLGSFAYAGSSINSTNDFYRIGIESEALYQRLRVRVSGILGKDDNPRGLNKPENSFFLMAQGQYLFMQNVLAAMRFEYQDIQTEGITRRYVPAVIFAPWQNVKFALEYIHEVRPAEINREGVLRVSFTF